MHHPQSRDVNASELGLVVNKEGGTVGGGGGVWWGGGGVRVREGVDSLDWSLQLFWTVALWEVAL